MFAWRRRRRRILVSKHGRRIVIFISDASVPRTSPSLTRFSQHLTTESEMEKGTGRTGDGVGRFGGEGGVAPHKANTVRGFVGVSEGMRAVPCSGVYAFLFYFGGKKTLIGFEMDYVKNKRTKNNNKKTSKRKGRSEGTCSKRRASRCQRCTWTFKLITFSLYNCRRHVSTAHASPRAVAPDPPSEDTSFFWK